MNQNSRLGMLTPSSNTVLEPVTTAILSGLPDVTAHFGRFRVTEISLSPSALQQFDLEPMLTAAELLADAKVDVTCWNGTSAGWLGFDSDRRLCEAIGERTGIPATSSVLALKDLFDHLGVRNFGLVSPYLDDVQAGIVQTFGAAGYRCVAERHLGKKVNYDFAEVTEATIRDMIREVAAERPDAVMILCTNMGGAGLAAELEAELGCAVCDSISAAVWSSLRLAGRSPASVQGWGRVFSV
ncbi:MAG: aspartate/glutamate racemase family protein [Kiloniellaceae bacterium]